MSNFKCLRQRRIRLRGKMSKKRRGVTLLEFLLYISILSSMTVGLLAFTVQFIKLYTVSRAWRDLAVNGRGVLDALAFQTFHAEQIYEATSIFDAAQGQLSLRTRRNPPQDEAVGYHDYWVADAHVWEKAEGGTETAITNDQVRVTSFLLRRFVDGSAEGVEVELMLEAPTPFSGTIPTMTFTRFILIRQR